LARFLSLTDRRATVRQLWESMPCSIDCRLRTSRKRNVSQSFARRQIKNREL
jgi:hypothetical protein